MNHKNKLAPYDVVTEHHDTNHNSDQTAVIKPLDSVFSSLGEALHSYRSYSNLASNGITIIAIRSFCDALSLDMDSFNSECFQRPRYYHTSAQWLYDYLRETHWIKNDRCSYIFIDVGNRPIARLLIEENPPYDFCVHVVGEVNIVAEVEALIKENIYFDPSVETQRTSAEISTRHTADGPMLVTITQPVNHRRISHPEYYPYLRGGVEALIKDFIESDDTVLVLMGPPGTGKSTSIMTCAETLNLLMISANDSNIISHPDFVDYTFGMFDQALRKYNDLHERKQKQPFNSSALEQNGTIPNDKRYRLKQDPYYGININEQACPIIVVEDADVLLAPRKAGNMQMSNLLNKTDGITSNVQRKIIFLTNITDPSLIDEGLLRVGRCYQGAPVMFRLLTPDEAVAARAVSGLPELPTKPTKDMSLAEVLVKPRQKIVIESLPRKLGFVR